MCDNWNSWDLKRENKVYSNRIFGLGRYTNSFRSTAFHTKFDFDIPLRHTIELFHEKYPEANVTQTAL